MRIAVVGCGAVKKEGTHEARNLYTSNYFHLKREYAEKVCDSWFILSAKHGLIRPDKEIECYDETVSDKSEEEIRSWAEDVYQRIHSFTDEFGRDEYEGPHRLVWLAGESYVRPVEQVVMSREEFVPRSQLPFRKTSGIGDQMAWLKEEIQSVGKSEDQSGLGDFCEVCK